jgi:uncharacterized protein
MLQTVFTEKPTHQIDIALHKIEVEKNIDIIYAVEAGSRAWGFASPDSDYDVRFIYAYPIREYLRIDLSQDAIERIEGNIDLAGWDIFKAARLLRKSNPPLMEWLFSPTVYIETPYIQQLRDIARHNYSSLAVYYHYSRMACNNYRQYITNKTDNGTTEVPIKKYLYAVRPILALLYFEQHNSLPPINFLETMREVELETDISNAILELVEKKQAGLELGKGKPIPVLNEFIEQHLNRWLQHKPGKDNKRHNFRRLDDIVLTILENCKFS